MFRKRTRPEPPPQPVQPPPKESGKDEVFLDIIYQLITAACDDWDDGTWNLSNPAELRDRLYDLFVREIEMRQHAIFTAVFAEDGSVAEKVVLAYRRGRELACAANDDVFLKQLEEKDAI